MSTFIVEVTEDTNGDPQFSANQTTGIASDATGKVTVTETCPVNMDIIFRWMGSATRAFGGVEHGGQAVTSGAISGTPLTASIPTTNEYTEFSFTDNDPTETCDWSFDIGLVNVQGADPAIFWIAAHIDWIDPKIKNDGAQPTGGRKRPGGGRGSGS